MPPHDLHRLFDPHLGQQSRRSRIAVFAGPLGLRQLPRNDDVSSVQRLVQPPLLREMLEHDKSAEEGREEDQEDASAGILTGAARGPRGRVEWCRGGGEEGHLHAGHDRIGGGWWQAHQWQDRLLQRWEVEMNVHLGGGKMVVEQQSDRICEDFGCAPEYPSRAPLHNSYRGC